MPSTYTPIATTTLGSAASSYTFTSIPGTYTDLVIIVNGVTSAASNNHLLRFNGDTGNNYSDTSLRGTGSAAASSRYSNNSAIVLTESGPLTSQFIHRINLPQYANTSVYKTSLSRSDAAGASTEATVGLWRNTAAITSVFINANGQNFAAGTTFTLYGIQAA